MASSSSALSPNKPSFQSRNPELLEWKNKCSRQPHLSGNEIQQLPNHDSAADQVTVENSTIKTKDLKAYGLRVPRLKKNNPPKVVEKAKGENPKSDDHVDASIAAALAAKETEKVLKSWHLRPRPGKPVCNPNGDASALNKGAPPVQHNKIPEKGRPRLPRGCQSKKPKKPKLKFSVSLTKEEIEEDLLKLTGKKPARRPKKRAKSLQKQLNNLTPASLLDGMSAETYKAD